MMMILLGQVTNHFGGGGALPHPSEYQSIGWVIVILAGLVTMANQAFKLKGSLFPSAAAREIQPQPLEVKTVGDLVKERDCKDRHATLESAISELRGQRIADAKDASFSRKSIYGEIEGVKREMGEMERRLNAGDEARTQELHRRINDILEAVGELRGKVAK